MTNHVHLIAVPRRQDSLAILLRRVHGRYAQYYNTRTGRTGHLWQNRFFACVLDHSHLWSALAYVDRNPVRAGITRQASDYPWSSAAAHVSRQDPTAILDMDWWSQATGDMDWGAYLREEDDEASASLRRCTYAGRPFGEEAFVTEMSVKFGRYWKRGRPKRQASGPTPAIASAQLAFFAD